MAFLSFIVNNERLLGGMKGLKIFSNTELSNYFISWNSICYLFHGKTKYHSKTLIPSLTCISRRPLH